jgi:hypothetical protein
LQNKSFSSLIVDPATRQTITDTTIKVVANYDGNQNEPNKYYMTPSRNIYNSLESAETLPFKQVDSLKVSRGKLSELREPSPGQLRLQPLIRQQ